MYLGCLSNDDGEGRVLNALLFFNFFEFISFNSLKLANIGKLSYGVLGTAPKFGSAKKLNFPCVYVLQTTSQKEIFYGCVRTS